MLGINCIVFNKGLKMKKNKKNQKKKNRINLLKDIIKITAHASQVWLLKENFAGRVRNVYIFRRENGDFAEWAAEYLLRKVTGVEFTKDATMIRIR